MSTKKCRIHLLAIVTYSDSDLLALLLPDAAHLRVNALDFDVAVSAMTLSVTAMQAQPCCPMCQQAAPRTHSRYTCSLADLPWATISVRLQFHVGKSFCDNPSCPQCIFTERLSSVVAP